MRLPVDPAFSPVLPHPLNNLDVTEGPVPASRLLPLLRQAGVGANRLMKDEGGSPRGAPGCSSTVDRPGAFVLRPERSNYRANRSWRRLVRTAIRDEARSSTPPPEGGALGRGGAVLATPRS